MLVGCFSSADLTPLLVDKVLSVETSELSKVMPFNVCPRFPQYNAADVCSTVFSAENSKLSMVLSLSRELVSNALYASSANLNLLK